MIHVYEADEVETPKGREYAIPAPDGGYYTVHVEPVQEGFVLYFGESGPDSEPTFKVKKRFNTKNEALFYAAAVTYRNHIRYETDTKESCREFKNDVIAYSTEDK